MKQSNANGKNIFLFTDADTLADSDFETWLPFADGHKREQLQSMRKQAAYISLVGILLAKYAIHTKWNIPIDQIRFGIGSHGKPYVIGYEQVHFNISHSDNICICAVDDRPIGKYLGVGFHYKPKDDTFDWKTEYMVHQKDYMICVCTKK